MNSKGQITPFVIIAILIVGAIIFFFLFFQGFNILGIDLEFSPIYDFYDSCIEQNTYAALNIAGSKGGYIDSPDFEPGNAFAPSSNQLDFLGIGVPYWFYVSRNGIIEEQIPSKSDIEEQISNYLADELQNCDFSSFRSQGFIVDTTIPRVEVDIKSNSIDVSVRTDLTSERGEKSVIRTSHDVNIESSFGSLYDTAAEIYEYELQEAVIENYSLDTMYNYAPVTGSEISCSPLIWNPQEVVSDLKSGLSANIGALKVEGDYYSLQDETDEYFVLDIQSDHQVNFLYDQNWPTKVEIWPAENGVLLSKPVGLDEGLGIIGFCFVPYHFVYDISHPVLVQISEGNEIFQFPFTVIIDKSLPRNSLNARNIVEPSSLDNFCNQANTPIDVYTFDNQLNPVEADISFECFNQVCSMGKTSVLGGDAILSEDFPQCVNGIVKASAEGYLTGEKVISTNNQDSTNIVLDKLYELNLEVVLGGLELSTRDDDGIAIIDFVGTKHRVTIPYPAQKTVKLTEDFYNISVQTFSGNELTIPGSSRRECVETTRGGIGGIFGATSEECFTIEIPSQTLDTALSGGGKTNIIILEDELISSNNLEISVPLLPLTNNLQVLQQNYYLVESQNVEARLI